MHLNILNLKVLYELKQQKLAKIYIFRTSNICINIKPELSYLPPGIGDSHPEGLIIAINKIAEKSILLDWSKVKKVSPAGIGIINCLCDSILERGLKVTSINIPKEFRDIPAIRILKSNSSKHLRPIRELDYNGEGIIVRGYENIMSMSFIEDFKQKNPKVKIEEDLEFDCNLILTELMQNSLDHAGAERYFAYMEVNEKEVNVGVLDMGVTIPAKLETKYSYNDDIEALKGAMKDKISTRRSRTGGKGLYFMFKQLEQRKGKLTILSRGPQIKRYFQHRTYREKNLKSKLKGTWCFCTLYKD